VPWFGDDFCQFASGAVVVADLCAAISFDGIAGELEFDHHDFDAGLVLAGVRPLSDAIGRKPIMVVTMAGSVLTTLALSQVESYATLLLLRGLQGLFLGGLPAIAIAYMGDEFSRKSVVLAVGVYN
jgi:hypothetical protein